MTGAPFSRAKPGAYLSHKSEFSRRTRTLRNLGLQEVSRQTLGRWSCCLSAWEPLRHTKHKQDIARKLHATFPMRTSAPSCLVLQKSLEKLRQKRNRRDRTCQEGGSRRKQLGDRQRRAQFDSENVSTHGAVRISACPVASCKTAPKHCAQIAEQSPMWRTSAFVSTCSRRKIKFSNSGVVPPHSRKGSVTARLNFKQIDLLISPVQSSSGCS